MFSDIKGFMANEEGYKQEIAECRGRIAELEGNVQDSKQREFSEQSQTKQLQKEIEHLRRELTQKQERENIMER